MSALYVHKDKNKFLKGKVRCFECNKYGHLAHECKTKKNSGNKMVIKVNKRKQKNVSMHLRPMKIK